LLTVIQELLLMPAVCRTRELRAFLSESAITATNTNGSQLDSKDFVSRIYNSVTEGMEEVLGNIPVLDQLSTAGQSIISAATAQLAATSSSTPNIHSTDGPMTNDEVAAAAEAEAELRAFENKELEPFVKPICDLFLEIFSLNRERNWLRGRAVVIVLHQLLGGTIERKVREVAQTYFEEDNLVKYLTIIRDMMWPGGKPRQQGVARTTQEKIRSRQETALLLATLVPDMAGSVVGKANAQQAARRITATLNNQRLK
jgi:sorting nexin-25